SGGNKKQSPIIQYFNRDQLQNNQAISESADLVRVQAIVGCGNAIFNRKIIIVNPETLEACPPRQVGEIWLAGPNNAQGYWNNPEATKETFQAYVKITGEGPFLRTGDLGFLQDGELFITGRIKDLIIMGGQNHYANDIELTVEKSHPALRPGCGAAF